VSGEPFVFVKKTLLVSLIISQLDVVAESPRAGDESAFMGASASLGLDDNSAFPCITPRLKNKQKMIHINTYAKDAVQCLAEDLLCQNVSVVHAKVSQDGYLYITKASPKRTDNSSTVKNHGT
jgi:hypothetical protein